MCDHDQDIALILSRLDDLARQLADRPVSPWMSTREAAEYLRCSLSKINRLAERGLLRYRRLDADAQKSKRLFDRRELTAYLVTGRNPDAHRLSPAERSLVDQLL